VDCLLSISLSKLLNLQNYVSYFRNPKFSQQWLWRLQSSGMWCHVVWYKFVLFYLLPHPHPIPLQHRSLLCETHGSQGGYYENNDIMKCNSMLSCRNVSLPFLKSVWVEVLMEMAVSITACSNVTSYTVA